MCTAAAMAGNGRHPYYLSNEQLSYAIKINSIALIPGVMAFSTPKLAVAFLLIRLLNPSKVHRWIMYFLSVSCIVLAGLCAVFLFVQCTPVRGLWTPTLQPKCWEPSVLVNFTIFTGCKAVMSCKYSFANQCSIFCLCRPILCSISSYYFATAPDQTPKEDWTIFRDESWFRVSITYCHFQSSHLTLSTSATIVAIYKCTRLPELGNHEDYTCE